MTRENTPYLSFSLRLESNPNLQYLPLSSCRSSFTRTGTARNATLQSTLRSPAHHHPRSLGFSVQLVQTIGTHVRSMFLQNDKRGHKGGLFDLGTEQVERCTRAPSARLRLAILGSHPPHFDVMPTLSLPRSNYHHLASTSS